jgi:hypothetical protein
MKAKIMVLALGASYRGLCRVSPDSSHSSSSNSTG